MYRLDPLYEVWERWSPRQLLEHYEDALRQERLFFAQFQTMVLERKGFKPVDWTWLDDLEYERWGEKGAGSAPKKSQRSLFETVRRKA